MTVEIGDPRLSVQQRCRSWLLPLSWGYGAIQVCRRAAYRSGLMRAARAPVPVISIGSLYAGGSGKTPFTAHVCERLKRRHVAVLSRGYRGTYREPQQVHTDSDPHVCGDEPVLLARRKTADVWVGRDRARLARQVGGEYDMLVLDDGFQHLRLSRDLNVCLLPDLPLDARLPAGLMREGPGALRDADFVLGAGTLPGWVAEHYAGPTGSVEFVPGAWQSPTGPAEPPDEVLAFSGIARPERFMASLARFRLTARVFFPDHHIFTEGELAKLWQRAKESEAEGVVTTAKDAVRIARFPGSLPVFWRDVEVRWHAGEDEFERLIASVMSE